MRGRLHSRSCYSRIICKTLTLLGTRTLAIRLRCRRTYEQTGPVSTLCHGGGEKVKPVREHSPNADYYTGFTTTCFSIKTCVFYNDKKKNKEFYYTYPSILKLSSTSERSPNTKNSQPKFQQQLTSDTLCRPTTHTARCRNSSWGKWRINAASREPTGQTGQPKRIIQSDHLDSIRSHLKRAILSGGNAAQETVRRRELKRVQQTHASAIGTSSEI